MKKPGNPREVIVEYVGYHASDPMKTFVEIMAEGVLNLLRKEGALKRKPEDIAAPEASCETIGPQP